MDGYYKRCHSLNKVKLSWVISEGRKGHEIQSMTLANALSEQVSCHRFTGTFLQDLLAPSPLGHTLQATQWQSQPPNTQKKPDLIISCGRKAAALARYMKKQWGCPVIQILNPKGNCAVYDVLLLPKHDAIQLDNSCSFTGSIHDISPSEPPSQALLAIMLGNPNDAYWQNAWQQDWLRWQQKNNELFICGSPRLSLKAQQLLRSHVAPERLWLNESDGPNPYLKLLQKATEFVVSGDSINMVNECLATQKPVEIMGTTDHLSARHQRFLRAVDDHQKNHTSQWPHPLDEIAACPKIQKLLNSPTSSKSG